MEIVRIGSSDTQYSNVEGKREEKGEEEWKEEKEREETLFNPPGHLCDCSVRAVTSSYFVGL